MYKFGEDPHMKFPSLSPFVLGQHITAVYYDQSVPQARGNPLAAVLNEGRSLKEVATLLRKRPSAIDPALRTRPSTERCKQLKADLHDLHAPGKLDLQLAKRVELAMCDSLHDRNPLEPPVAFRPPERAFTLLGPAGVGKSAALQHVLMDLFPQRITHTCFQGRPFAFEQILWMHLEVPPLGTVKQLCHSFFRYAEAILKKPYYAWYTNNGRASDDRMLANMGTVISNHGIALLSLDEVGRLAMKGAEAQRQLNALFGLLNCAGVAVCLTGTFEALPLLRAHGRVLGRISAHGDWILDRMTENSREWKEILKAYDSVQYVRHPVELSGKIAEAFYAETQGFIRFFKELFYLTQRAAMEDGSERLTPELIHRTARQELQLAGPMLTAFRLGDREMLKRFPQMFPKLEDPIVRDVASRSQIKGALRKVPEMHGHSSATAQSQHELEDTPPAPPNPLPTTDRLGKGRRRAGRDYESPLRASPGTLPHIVTLGRQENKVQEAYLTLEAAGVIGTALELLPVEAALQQSSENHTTAR